MKHHTKLTKTDRSEIAILKGRGYSDRAVARAMDRSPNTISDEIRKNSVKGAYDPQKAHAKARARRKNAKYQGMKVVDRPELRTYVERHLTDGWSPEQISGRIKKIDTHMPYISPKGIYKYVSSAYGGPFVWYLRRKGKRPRGKYTGKAKTAWKEGRTFIDERPDIVDIRGRFGDWEGDFIESGRGGTGYLLVLYERLTRYMVLSYLKRKDTKSVHKAAWKLLASYPVHTLTLDNDISFQKHTEIAEMLETTVYFCHPYHSWEKGGVENVNGLIREYVKKRSDLSMYHHMYLKKVQRVINQRPRKCLGFMTPEERMREELHKTRISMNDIFKGTRETKYTAVAVS